jgi:hypothetical protein
MYLNDGKSGYNKNSCSLMFIAALFTIAKQGILIRNKEE